MKIFLDTNVLASAAATRGLCADVFREVLTSHELIISEALLHELERTLRQKFRVEPSLIDEFVDMLQHDAILVQPSQHLRINIHDKDDVIIISSALAANADILVTGDKELLTLGKVEDLEILSPREFWEKLKT